MQQKVDGVKRNRTAASIEIHKKRPAYPNSQDTFQDTGAFLRGKGRAVKPFGGGHNGGTCFFRGDASNINSPAQLKHIFKHRIRAYRSAIFDSKTKSWEYSVFRVAPNFQFRTNKQRSCRETQHDRCNLSINWSDLIILFSRRPRRTARPCRDRCARRWWCRRGLSRPCR